jgi:hypothetical protein
MRFEPGGLSRNVTRRRASPRRIASLVTLLMTPLTAAGKNSPLQTSGHLDLGSTG